MSRTLSTITWGAALIVAAIVLNWQQSIPWSLAAAGAVPVTVGLAKGLIDLDATDAAKREAAGKAKTAKWAAEHPRP